MYFERDNQLLKNFFCVFELLLHFHILSMFFKSSGYFIRLCSCWTFREQLYSTACNLQSKQMSFVCIIIFYPASFWRERTTLWNYVFLVMYVFYLESNLMENELLSWAEKLLIFMLLETERSIKSKRCWAAFVLNLSLTPLQFWRFEK